MMARVAGTTSKAIAKGGQLDALVRELDQVEKALDEARHRHAKATMQRAEFGEIACKEDVATRLDEAIHTLARSSYEFADLMRRVFPEFVIQPVQALDCGQVRPRGTLKFRPSGVSGGVPGDVGTTDKIVLVDLFDMPQKINDAVRVRKLLEGNPGMSPKAISRQMDIGIMRAKRARDYARLMIADGQEDPYRELTREPPSASRWKPRHPR